MGQLAGSLVGNHASLDQSESLFAGDISRNISWQSLSSLADLRANAIGSPDGLLISNRARRQARNVIVPTQHVVRKLESVGTAVKKIDDQAIVIACTNALEARCLTADEDPQDRRYLTGARTTGGLYVYCGTIAAAVRRALVYALYADVICYRATGLDLAEARSFLCAIRKFFPEKPLGINISIQRGLDPFRVEEQLSQLGYAYCFLSVADSLVPSPTFAGHCLWALVDDSAEYSAAQLAQSELSSPAGTLPQSSDTESYKPTHKPT